MRVRKERKGELVGRGSLISLINDGGLNMHSFPWTSMLAHKVNKSLWTKMAGRA